MGTRLIIKGADFSNEIAPTLDVFFTIVDKKIVISCESVDSSIKIYYTTDGSEPDSNSNLYTEPLQVEHGTTIKAVAYKNNNTIKGTVNSYTFEDVNTLLSWRDGYYSYGTGHYTEDSASVKYKTLQKLESIDAVSKYSKITVNEGFLLRFLCYSSENEDDFLGYSGTVQEYSLSSNKPGTKFFAINLSYNPASDISDIDAQLFANMSGIKFVV